MYRPSAVLATVLSTFALTATASASSYCVAPATGCDATATSLQDALTQAATHAGDDSVSLGAATYAQDGLVYNPGDNARVSITGAGSATVIQPATATDSAATLHGTTGPIDISNVKLVAGGATTTWALELNAGGTVQAVQAVAAAGATSPSAFDVASPVTISGVTVSMPGNGACVLGHGTGTVTVRDSTLSDCSAGINGQSAETVAQRLRLLNVVNGMGITGNGVHGHLDDSLVTLRGGATGAIVTETLGSTHDNSLQLNQDTFIGNGGGTGASAGNFVVSGHTAYLNVYDSIFRAFTTPLHCNGDSGHPASVSADYNAYTGTTSSGAGCTGLTSTHVYPDDPLFVDAANGDYHLQPSSPLIDQDAFPIDIAGGESATDLDGTVRIINAKRDLGAFERPLAPAAATAAATDVTQTTATVPATANGGGAQATVKLVYGSTSAYGSEIPLDSTHADFTDSLYAVALSGLSPSTTYHYALVVTNSAGSATSADQTLTTAATPAAPPTVCCAPPPVAKAALSSLKISPSRFRAASKGATFAKARIGATVRYTLSAAGTVKLRVLRAAKGVRSGGRCVAKSRTHRTGKACTRYVAVGKAISRPSSAGTTTLRFSGRVGGKKLKPGRYRLQSLDPAGATKRASFTIVRR